MKKQLVLDESKNGTRVTRVLLQQNGDIIEEDTENRINVKFTVNGSKTQWGSASITTRRKL